MKIIKNEVLKEKYHRFDLSIEDTHNFLCNNIVVHNTSAHVAWKSQEKQVRLFSGGEKHENFKKLFNEEALIKKFTELFPDRDVIIFGEAYGGKQQGMSHTYGKQLKFIGFDVKIGDYWLDVPNAEGVCKTFEIEFVDYVKIPTDLDSINRERDKDSTQAIRNGVGEGKMREGVVLRPLVELRINNGDRIISKHKRDEFKETKTPREVNPEELKVLTEAKAIADEWVTEMRLQHVLDKMPPETNIESMGKIIQSMVEDVYREAKGEIVESKEVTKFIGSRTAQLFKQKLQSRLNDK